MNNTTFLCPNKGLSESNPCSSGRLQVGLPSIRDLVNRGHNLHRLALLTHQLSLLLHFALFTKGSHCIVNAVARRKHLQDIGSQSKLNCSAEGKCQHVTIFSETP